MPEMEAAVSIVPERIRPFSYTELELNLSLSTKSAEPYWVEAVYEVPAPLSLAPDKNLSTAKALIGILSSGEQREKRVKVYAGSDTYPEIYKIKVTLFIYDKDGAISERKEYIKELECAEVSAKVAQPT
ncbi:MAG: hypothetical protein KGH53_02325 [Candidatus Micrarchaeota archaeon]|nr:hypothetical protein [Candidatus Micrarchaeota archaeon]